MKVFLSSTAQDLTAYRQVADDTILRLSHSPRERCGGVRRGPSLRLCARAGQGPAGLDRRRRPSLDGEKEQNLLTDPAVLAHTRSGGAGPPQLDPRR